MYGLGQRAVVEGLVFPKFEIIDHIPREATRHRYVGMDLGYSNDSTAIVEVCLWKDRMYINEICYRTHMLTNDIIRELKEIDWEPEIISESADPRMIDEIYNAGLDIHPVHKYQGSINAGLMKMKEYKIHITRQSSNIIKEFRNYTYRQDKEGKWLNEPIDSFNHCFVGETLVSTIKGDLRIDNVKVGDIVKTSKGNHKITKIFDNGTQKVLRVRFFFNNFVLDIEATPNHLFKTKEGWKKLEELKASDVLYLDRSLMEKSIISTKESVTIQEERKDCTGLCGNTITEKSHRATTSITKMETPKTTLLKILNWCKRMSIFTSTPKSICNQKSIWQKLASKWHTLLNMQKNGTNQKRVGNGIANTQENNQNADNTIQKYVDAVEKNIEREHSALANSVPITVNPNGAEIITSTMKCESVSYAGKSLLSTNTAGYNSAVEAVVCDIVVLNESYKQVYDIEVEEAHEFFANGILVHNCIDAIRYVVLEKILGAYGSGMSASEILGIVG